MSSQRKENIRILQLAKEGKLTKEDLLNPGFDIYLDLRTPEERSHDPLPSDQEQREIQKAIKSGRLIRVTLNLNES